MERLSWIVEGLGSALPALAAALVIVAYGVAACRLIGVRSGLLALAAAVPTGIVVLMLAAQVVGMLGIGVPIAAHAFVGLGIALLVGLVSLRSRRGPPSTAHDTHVLVWAGMAIGVLGALAVWVGGIGSHALPPQSNDEIWHGYLVERLTHMPIITAGTVAPTLADSASPVLFYQYGLHLAWALGHAVTGASVAEALNGGWLVHVAVLLPVGATALARSLYPERPWVAFWAGVLSPSVVIFPYLTNGLLPYTASLAMIPGFLALLVTQLRADRTAPRASVALAAAGIFVAHPAGAIVGALIAVPVSIEVILRRRGVAARRDGVARLMSIGLIAAAAAFPWLVASSERGLGEAPALAAVDVPSALGLVVTLGTPWTSPQPVIGFLAAAGIVATIVRRRGVGLSVAYAVLAILFVGTVAGLGGFAAITQSWHAQWYRLAAALGVLVPILAGLGMASVIGVVRAGIAPRLGPARRFGAAAIAAVVLVVGAGAAYASAQGQSIVRDAWHSRQLVQATDVELFRELARMVEPGDRVFNSPRDGSSWMYALDGVIPMHPYIYLTPRWSWDLVNGLAVYEYPSVACWRLQREHLTYAVVKQVTGDLPGLEAYDIGGFVERHPDLFVEVARTDTAIAYRIDQEAVRNCISG
ncbi:MAG TPA: DUF6541 family protein [Candidatus Limnocylindria bacterium]|nr:DUF6541 family protein [Candidatus Limnocylindria bacterium]